MQPPALHLRSRIPWFSASFSSGGWCGVKQQSAGVQWLGNNIWEAVQCTVGPRSPEPVFFLFPFLSQYLMILGETLWKYFYVISCHNYSVSVATKLLKKEVIYFLLRYYSWSGLQFMNNNNNNDYYANKCHLQFFLGLISTADKTILNNISVCVPVSIGIEYFLSWTEIKNFPAHPNMTWLNLEISRKSFQVFLLLREVTFHTFSFRILLVATLWQLWCMIRNLFTIWSSELEIRPDKAPLCND